MKSRCNAEICQRTYDLIFISDCPVLDNRVNQALIEYVKSGGILVGSGRPPLNDLAANRLAARLLSDRKIPTDAPAMKAVASPTVERLGKGMIYWISDKLGRSYWGKVRRDSLVTNTPPIYTRLDYSDEAGSLRRFIRQSVNGMIDSVRVKQPAKIDVSEGTIHLAIYRKPNSNNEMLLFLLHTGQGRSHSVPVTLDSSVKLKKRASLGGFRQKRRCLA